MRTHPSPTILLACLLTALATGCTAASSSPTGPVEATLTGDLLWLGTGDRIAVEPITRVRDGGWEGTLALTAGDTSLTGPGVAVLDVDALDIDGPLLGLHTWGTIEVTFDDLTCDGAVGGAALSGEDGGGAITLSCSDGSLFAGELTGWTHAGDPSTDEITITMVAEGLHMTP